ncbi:DUF3852 family protein [Peribacillus frigoritolerans]|uniref:DUF3852 family protein n=1 Tax=Peribacillus frigoritolerans TaxID=450367 RepID=UPI003F7CDCFA
MTSLKKLQILLMFAAILLLLHIAPEQASAAANVSAKIKEGLKQVQTLLTGLVVTVGICVSIWIIINFIYFHAIKGNETFCNRTTIHDNFIKHYFHSGVISYSFHPFFCNVRQPDVSFFLILY